MDVFSSTGQINYKDNSYEVDSQKSFCNGEAALAPYKETERAKYLR
jgi:hypothetical protein